MTPCRTFAAAVVVWASAGMVGHAAAGERAATAEAEELAGRLLLTIDLILERHVDPPTRQQMVLEASRALLEQTKEPLPVGLSRKISDFEPGRMQPLLAQFSSTALERSTSSAERIETMVLQRLLKSLPGGAALTSQREQAVADQFAANRYVGTGIALSMDKSKRPVMQKVFEGGPARRVGALDGDVIEVIDGLATTGKSIRDVVEMLRGPEGSEVTVVLRQPDQPSSRELTIIRGVVPLVTVTDYQLFGDGSQAKVAYLRIERLSVSNVDELRRFESRMRLDNVAGLVLDLRFLRDANAHHGVLLADALLESGSIGQVRTPQGLRQYEAGPQALFREVKLAVLVSRYTSGTAEWLSAALKDNQRAVLVGSRTAGDAYAKEAIRLPGGELVLVLATGELLRSDGSRFAKPPDAPAAPNLHRVESVSRRPSEGASWGVLPDELIEPASDIRSPTAIRRAVARLRREIATGA